MIKKLVLYALVAVAALSACKKEVINEYQIDDVHVPRNEGEKGTLKSDQQFISIAYSDLFGKEISTSEKGLLLSAYNSLGDKDVIIDRIIRSFLIKPGIQVPTDKEMRDDPEKFVDETFPRFVTRSPAELEKWYLVNAIKQNQDFTSREIYYILMSSKEYRYY